MGYTAYINGFEGTVQKYVPAGSERTPSDDAVFGPIHPYEIPNEESVHLRFKAIKYQFSRHYEHNKMYHNFCKESGIVPDDLRTEEDLVKVPMIPSDFFKNHPTGRDFALWLANIFTGEMPKVKISGKAPTHDEVIDAFNKAGMAVCYSSGTGGKHTFVPRDMRSFNANEYVLSKGAISMFYPSWNKKMAGCLLMPNPARTSLFAGRLGTVFFDVMYDVKVPIDRDVDTETIRASMSEDDSIKGKIIKVASNRFHKKVISDIIEWIERNDKAKRELALVGAPYLLYEVMEQLKEEGRTFDLKDRAIVLTGGGWKVHENARVPESEFRKNLENTFGISPDRCLDIYGMVEGNGWMTQCPEGHHLHIPTGFIHPMVLDDSLHPIGYGEYGHFAFLDGSMYGYPGFIITNDKVRMLEHCPVCGRPGPVLEPGVTRMAGKETRGCAEEVRKMVTKDIGGMGHDKC